MEMLGITLGENNLAKVMGMNRINRVLAGLSVLALYACQAFFVDDRDTSVVQFSATAGDARTKTEYGGAYSGENGTLMELIRWVPNKDAVTIHMRCKDQNDNPIVPGHNVANYNIATVLPEKEGDYISRGTISPSDGSESLRWQGYFADGRAYEYAHQFYSVYPKENDDIEFDETNHTFTFYGLPAQDGTMDYAYMTAVKEYTAPREKNTDKVQLDYYPMVTTVYVTLTNDTGASISNFSEEITLSTSNENAGIVGSFRASVQGNKFIPEESSITGKETTITNTISADELGIGKSVSIPFFLLPRQYDPGDLILTVFGKSHTLAGKGVERFYPCKKYNITVNLNESGIDIEISDAMAQLIFTWLLDGQKLQQFDIDFNAFNISRNENWSTNPADALLAFFTKDGVFDMEKWQKLLDMLLTATDIRLQDKIMDSALTGQELKKYFPNLTKIDLKTEADLDIDGLEDLTTIHLYDHPTSVTIRNCEKLGSINIENTNENSIIELEELDNLTSLSITSKAKKISLKHAEKIETLNINQPVDTLKLEDLESLNTLSLDQVKNVTVKDCTDLSSLSINNMSNSNLSFDNCGFTVFLKDAWGNIPNTNNAVIELKNMLNLSTIALSGMKELHVSSCGLTSYSARDPWNNPLTCDIIEFTDMDLLTSIDAGNAQKVIVKNCAILKTVSPANKTENQGGCPNLTNY